MWTPRVLVEAVWFPWHSLCAFGFVRGSADITNVSLVPFVVAGVLAEAGASSSRGNGG